MSTTYYFHSYVLNFMKCNFHSVLLILNNGKKIRMVHNLRQRDNKLLQSKNNCGDLGLQKMLKMGVFLCYFAFRIVIK